MPSIYSTYVALCLLVPLHSPSPALVAILQAVDGEAACAGERLARCRRVGCWVSKARQAPASVQSQGKVIWMSVAFYIILPRNMGVRDCLANGGRSRHCHPYIHRITPPLAHLASAVSL